MLEEWGSKPKKTRIRVCAAFKSVMKEISFTVDLSADRGRGAVETEWVAMVWTVMLVHDD